MLNLQKYILLSITLLLISCALQAQIKTAREKSFYKALDLIYYQKYDQALQELYHLDTIEIKPFLKNSENYKFYVDSQYVSLEKIYVKYLIAVCHLERDGQRNNALPYIEYILESGYSETPEIIYKDLGRLYHLDYQFEKSQYYFNKYLKSVDRSDEFYEYTQNMLKVTENAINALLDTAYKDITPLEFPITTAADEHFPIISQNGELLYFMRNNNGHNQILMSVRKLGIWTKPLEISFPQGVSFDVNQIKLAGLGPDGQNPAIYITHADRLGLYTTSISDYKCFEIKEIPVDFLGINDTKGVSFSDDGETLFFSSSRPGGFGGYDIYLSNLRRNNTWSKPENLGEAINSRFDEVSPFYFSPAKTLYFSSNNLKTIGNLDIFYSSKSKKAWLPAQNMGFAINTTSNNTHFSMPNNGALGYYNSPQTDNNVIRDIYLATIEKSIPLTFLNGQFMAGNPPKPISVKIKVIDKRTGEKVKYVFSSKDNVGKYFMIFAPDREYDMLIEAEGYASQLITIYVPKQTYFYELFQKVMLRPDEEKYLEEITVTNSFYDLYTDADKPSTSINRDMYSIMNQIVNKTEDLSESSLEKINELQEQKQSNKDYGSLLNLIEEAIETVDSTTLTQLENKARHAETYRQTYIVSRDKNKSERQQVIFDKDTFYVAPPLKAYTQSDKDNINGIVKARQMTDENTDYQDKNMKQGFFNHSIYIADLSDLSQIDQKVLKDIAALLNSNSDLELLIEAEANPIGDVEHNLEKAMKQAKALYQYLLSLNCKCDNTLLKSVVRKSQQNLSFEKNKISFTISDTNK